MSKFTAGSGIRWLETAKAGAAARLKNRQQATNMKQIKQRLRRTTLFPPKIYVVLTMSHFSAPTADVGFLPIDYAVLKI